MARILTLLVGIAMFTGCAFGEVEDLETQTEDDLLGICPAIFAPVCGDDGRTHSNACLAESAGVTVLFPSWCADFDLNSCVEFVDFLVLAANYGGFGDHADGDADGDGDIDDDDFTILQNEYGEGLSCD